MGGSATLDDDVLVDSLVADVIDGLRADLHPQFGVRPYRTFTVVRTWAGQEIGEGGYTDVETEIEPQPRVREWGDTYAFELKNGIDEKGQIKLTEVSLTYTAAELGGAEFDGNQQFFVKLTEAHGQGNPDRWFILARPPYVDREKDMGWVLYLRASNVPGCSP